MVKIKNYQRINLLIPKIGPNIGKNIATIVPIQWSIILDGKARHINVVKPPFNPIIVNMNPIIF